MANTNSIVEKLYEKISDLSPEDFRLLNQQLDGRRQNRLKEILKKTRDHSKQISDKEKHSKLQEAITEVRAENAAYGRS